jgi:hypothetical protein
VPCRRSTTELDIESVAENSISDWGAARGLVWRQNGGRDRDEANPSQQKQSVKQALSQQLPLLTAGSPPTVDSLAI